MSLFANSCFKITLKKIGNADIRHTDWYSYQLRLNSGHLDSKLSSKWIREWHCYQHKYCEPSPCSANVQTKPIFEKPS